MPKHLKVSTVGFVMREQTRGDRSCYGEICASPHIIRDESGAAQGWETRENHGGVMVTLLDTRETQMVFGEAL